MRIDQSVPQTNLAQNANVKATAATQSPAATQSAITDVHTPSADLVQLLTLSGQVPEVRNDLVKEVAQRMASGEYRKPPARDAAVQAMLGSQPG